MASATVAAATLPSLRTGPKLEIPGYGCRDHQREGDIFLHRWAVLAQIISDDVTKDSLVDLGMRSRHRNVRHHCRTCTYKCVLFIRLKISLANNGPYGEARHFMAWVKPLQTETYYVEKFIAEMTGQATVPIGDSIFSTRDTAGGIESCEETFTLCDPSTNASHSELRKLRQHGDARIMLLAQYAQFFLEPVEVITATVDLEQGRAARVNIAGNVQAAAQPRFSTADNIYLSSSLVLSTEQQLRILDPMSEMRMSCTVYRWQYLTRKRSAYFFHKIRPRAERLVAQLGAYYMSINIDSLVQEDMDVAKNALEFTPK
ncbi:carbon-nitrogen hydrolase [Nemania serpens]|nr:carbon-nitrogen hydrolase [Nemania serpens]